MGHNVNQSLAISVLFAIACFSAISTSTGCVQVNHDVEEDLTESELHSLLVNLENSCLDQPLFCGMDMGVYRDYSPSVGVKNLVQRLSNLGVAARGAIVQKYCGLNATESGSVPVETVFALLDILLRLEHQSGVGTKETRRELWVCWSTKFHFAMSTLYKAPLQVYEENIRNTW